MTELHLIYTDNGPGYGWSIESPQIPELIGGRSKLDDLIRDTNLILEFADAPIKDANAAGVFRHEQIATEDPSGFEYLIRWLVNEEADGDDPMSRVSTAGRLLSSAREGYPEYLRARQPELVTGERLLIAVMGTDTIGFILDQLKEGQGAIIAQHRGEDAVYSVPIGISASLDGWTWELEDLGLTRDDSVEKVIDSVLDWEANKLGSRPQALKNHALNLPPSRIPQGDMVHLYSVGTKELH